MSISGCKKPDKNPTTTTKNKKAPIKYLRFNGVDGELILSTSTENLIDSVGHIGIITVDTLITYNQQEIFGYFPGDGGSVPLLGAGNMFFNNHQVYEAGTDSSYYLQTTIDTFNFDTTTVFTSNWVVQAGVFPGFTETCTTNQFPSAFHFQLDTAMHKSTGYLINLNPGGALIYNADSIVYMMYNSQNTSNFVMKVVPTGTLFCNFTSSDLSVFSSSTTVSIDIIAYNYRQVIKNGAYNIYFMTQTRVTNDAIGIRS